MIRVVFFVFGYLVMAIGFSFFNRKRYSSWESLRNEKIQNYGGAKKHLNWQIIQSWLDCEIVEKVSESERATCTINPLQVAESSAVVGGKLVQKFRPVLHCKIKKFSIL